MGCHGANRARGALVVLLGVSFLHCSHDDGYSFPPSNTTPRCPDAGATCPDAGPCCPNGCLPDGDGGVPEDAGPGRPSIVITSPAPDEAFCGGTLEVLAIITDPDGVDLEDMWASLPNSAPVQMRPYGTLQNQFRAVVEATPLETGTYPLRVEASTISELENAVTQPVLRDQGPAIVVFAPEDGPPYPDSLGLDLVVIDDFGLDMASIETSLGGVAFPYSLMQADNTNGDHPRWMLAGGTIQAGTLLPLRPPLDDHDLVVRATNIHGCSAWSVTEITVDVLPPVIKIIEPEGGQLVGGLTRIEAQVTDEDGVNPCSVVAEIGVAPDSYLIALDPAGDRYTATFNAQGLTSMGWLMPPLTVYAADYAGNRSRKTTYPLLDSTPPIASLDPPILCVASLAEASALGLTTEDASAHSGFEPCPETPDADWRCGDGDTYCSRPFDPLGPGTPSDLDRVPAWFTLRARVEDPTVPLDAEGTPAYVPSLGDGAVEVYLLPGTGEALVVDTDEDGLCDAINPELTPSLIPQGPPEVLVLELMPIPTGGRADFRPPGSEADPPLALCDGAGGMTMVLPSAWDDEEPAIYGLAEASPGTYCAGQYLDARANNLPEGWLCVAVLAHDQFGNAGVSPPLRLCVDYALDGVPACAPDQAPHCTGTWDPVTQVTSSAVPCTFSAAQQFVPDETRLLATP